MARSARDATRFTATQPHAAFQPLQGKGSTIQLDSKPPPPNETPQQKVARLRSAAQKARAAQVSTIDTILDRGRKVADRAHRTFNVGLLIASVGCIGIGIYAFIDLSLYKRRRNRDWEAKWREDRAQLLADAYDAVKLNSATAEQQTLIETQLAHEAELERKKNQTWTQFLFGSLQKEEKPGGTMNIAWKSPLNDATALAADVSHQMSDDLGVVTAAEGSTGKDEMRSGGVLDVMASNAAASASNQVRSWTSWLSTKQR